MQVSRWNIRKVTEANRMRHLVLQQAHPSRVSRTLTDTARGCFSLNLLIFVDRCRGGKLPQPSITLRGLPGSPVPCGSTGPLDACHWYKGRSRRKWAAVSGTFLCAWRLEPHIGREKVSQECIHLSTRLWMMQGREVSKPGAGISGIPSRRNLFDARRSYAVISQLEWLNMDPSVLLVEAVQAIMQFWSI